MNLFAFLYHRQDLATISGIGFDLNHDSLLKNDYMDLLLKDKFCYLRIKGCHQVMKIDSLLQCTFVCICWVFIVVLRKYSRCVYTTSQASDFTLVTFKVRCQDGAQKTGKHRMNGKAVLKWLRQKDVWHSKI